MKFVFASKLNQAVNLQSGFFVAFFKAVNIWQFICLLLQCEDKNDINGLFKI